MFWKRLEKIFERCLEDLLKTSSKRLDDVFKTSWRCFEDVLKTFLKDVLNTSWRHFEDVLARLLKDFLKTTLKRLKDVLATYNQHDYIGLDQDFLKTSWRRMSYLGQSTPFYAILLYSVFYACISPSLPFPLSPFSFSLSKVYHSMKNINLRV